jgi:hypothetical protein
MAAVAIVLVASLLAAPGRSAAHQVYDLRQGKAAALMREALSRRFGSNFEHAYGRRVVCHKRLSRDRRRCSMSWVIGDMGFFGKGQIWITYPEHRPFWNYAFKVAMLNEYCVAMGGDDCLHWRVVR